MLLLQILMLASTGSACDCFSICELFVFVLHIIASKWTSVRVLTFTEISFHAFPPVSGCFFLLVQSTFLKLAGPLLVQVRL